MASSEADASEFASDDEADREEILDEGEGIDENIEQIGQGAGVDLLGRRLGRIPVCSPDLPLAAGSLSVADLSDRVHRFATQFP